VTLNFFNKTFEILSFGFLQSLSFQHFLFLKILDQKANITNFDSDLSKIKPKQVEKLSKQSVLILRNLAGVCQDLTKNRDFWSWKFFKKKKSEKFFLKRSFTQKTNFFPKVYFEYMCVFFTPREKWLKINFFQVIFRLGSPSFFHT